ncbi:MAG TPA: pyridoxamine 5'-phosphate oxidase family protein [Solirubrobacterales bacterium]|nr:pyridoxamine 5'-phosphate oxidase family protein [Solirubrobacterales bacterium]
MTSSLPRRARDCFERFITCEYVTIDSRQRPIVWPVTPYYRQGAATIDVTTGLGYPKKADDAARNPHVALLFSDPTGSGIEAGTRVLVQGTAEIDERDPEANRRRYWRESREKLPGMQRMHPPRPLRPLFSWYYTRIYVKVRPERVFLWPDGDQTKPPEVLDAHLEEVRSGQSEEPLEPHEPVEGGPVAWHPRLGELGSRHPTAVVAWVAPDGFPLAARLPVSPDATARRIALEAEPAGLPLTAGRACLVAHAHDERFSWQENFQVRGDLVRDGDRWAIVPHKLLGGFELPDESIAARYRRNLGKAVRFWRAARRRRSGPDTAR